MADFDLEPTEVESEDFDAQEAEAYPQETVDVDESERNNLMDFELEEVEKMWADGTIDDDTASMYLAQQDRMTNGISNMEPENVEFLNSKGLISDEMANDYLDQYINPQWYQMKDIMKAPINGVRNFTQNLWALARTMPIINPLAPFQGEMIPDFAKPKDYKPMISPLADLPHAFSPTKTGAGRLIEGLTEFFIPFGITSKVLKSGQFAQTVIRKLPEAAKKFPKLVGFLEYTLADTTAGAVADMSFDPYEGRISDMMSDAGILPEFLNFMQTNPENPAAIERFKTVLEGAALGLAFDAVLFGSQLFKSQIWDRHMGDAYKVSDEINEKFGMFLEPRQAPFEEPVQQYFKKHTEVDGIFYKPGDAIPGTGVMKRIDDIAPPKPTEPELTIRSHADAVADYDRAFKTFDEVAESLEEGAEKVVPTRKVTEMIEEAGGNGAALTEAIYRNVPELMDVARRGKADPVTGVRKSRKKTQKGADKYVETQIEDYTMKDLAKDVGGGHVKTFARKMADQMEEFGLKIKNMDETVRAFNQVFRQYTDEVFEMVKYAQGPTGAFVDKLRALEHMKVLEEMEISIFGIRSDIGRTLGVYNEDWIGTRFDWSKIEAGEMDNIKKLHGDEIDNIMNQFSKASTHRQKMKLARFTGRNKWLQGAVELVQANLLWNPATHVVNIVGNATALALETGVRVLAVTGEAITKGDMSQFRELQHYATGLSTALSDSFRIDGLANFAKHPSLKAFKEMEYGLVWKALLTGDGQLDRMAKLDGQLGSGLENIVSGWPKLPKIMGLTMAKIVKLPFHSLTAGDELFKNLGYRSELNTLIYRHVASEGLSPAKAKLKMDLLKENVPSDMHYAALNRARDITFQAELGKGTLAKGTAQALNSAPGTVVQIMAVPFFKIAVNLTKFSAARSPLALLSRKFYKDFMTGGITRNEAVARVATGSALMMYGASLYDQEIITGRIPEGQREAWQNAGKLPYAVKIGGKYYSYDRLDPLAMILGLSADAAQLWDIHKYNRSVPEHKAIEFSAAVALTFSEPVVNKTWMKGISELMKFITQPDRMNLEKYGMKQLEKFIPGHTGIEWYHKTFTHSNIPDMNEWSDVYMKKLEPTEQQHIRHSVYGTKVEREPDTALILRTGSPTDPVAVEMVNIQLSIKKPEKSLPDGREMTPEQYAEYNDLIAGFPIQASLAAVISNPGYQAIHDNETKGKLLRKVVSSFRKAAKAQLIAGSKTITDNMVIDAMSNAENIAGATTENDARKALYHRLTIKEIK